MCWDQSTCENCGRVTYCITQCYCDEESQEDGSCPHRDCKSFDVCFTCREDLCSDCDDTCEKCGEYHCDDHSCSPEESAEESASAEDST